MTREQGTGNREQGTGNREQGTGNREQGTGNREQVLRHGDRCYATGTGATPRGQVTGATPRGQGIGNREEVLDNFTFRYLQQFPAL
jgi:hypothetical protein